MKLEPDFLSSIESYLAGVVMLNELNEGWKRKNWKYSCAEAVVKELGTRFKKHDDTVKKMRARRCFDNSFKLSLETGLNYCEGWAASVIAIHHAWCCDDDGVVYDPTWRAETFVPVNREYVGCVFEREFVMEQALKNGHAGLFSVNPGFINLDIVNGRFKLKELNHDL